MGDTFGRLIETTEWKAFAAKTTDNDAIWPVLDDADESDVEDLFGILDALGPLEPRVAAMILLAALFLPIDVPIEGNEWRYRLIESLRTIASAPGEHPDFKFMAEMNLKNARAQDIAHERKTHK